MLVSLRIVKKGVVVALFGCVKCGNIYKNVVLILKSLTRDFTPTKPDPASLLYICKQWGVHPKSVVMVGDQLQDIQCGKSAGSGTSI